MTAVTLDRFERRILSALQEDSSRSTAEIAEIAGLSPSPCWRRIDRLQQEGVIVRRVALVDRRKVGLNVQIFAQVKLNAHGRAHLDEFSAAIREFAEVLEC
jgi:Lrp/AsnC family transcriptional regulator